MPHSRAAFWIATGKFAGNEAAGKPVRAAVPEPLFPALSEIKGASGSYRERGQALSPKEQVISFN